ncbi:MAG: biopolymer transporter ExbD [Chitinivibrionales bacterium]|nr:biopolymer transporter ExbD [Chitinivibrionales bacterium]
MPVINSIRQKRKKRGNPVVKLNITSMIDMFTLMVVFLLQTYSSQGQLVTPAEGLRLPKSSVEKTASEAVSVKISMNSILVGNTVVVDEKAYEQLKKQKEFLIEPLHTALVDYATESKKSAQLTGKEFSGKVAIQGDEAVAYNILTRIMYTCGQAGFPTMNLIVYRQN